MSIQIDVINASTVVTDAEVIDTIAALQIQVTRDFAPAYGIYASLFFGTDKSRPGAWQLVIGDDSDQMDALGYHELTAQGQPLGKVFAKTTKQDGAIWTVTASHELLEMLADPWACLCAEGPDGKIRAYEVADAVEDDQFGYSINEVLLSDFVFPSWFDGSSGPLDFQRKATVSGELLPGGYISILQNGGWEQVTASHAGLARQSVLPGSRRSKRRMAKKEWRKSL